MIEPQFTIKTEKQHDNYSQFVIEPLPRGFGNTLGNSLRRVLYSYVPGAAITNVRIGGVNHQFTTLEGVREDVVQLVLAIKQVRVSYSGEKPATITLNAKGSGEVTAAQFNLPPDVIISNPQMVIAHLADKSAKLEIEATVETGTGYSPADDRRSSTVGVIPVDASFTPVLRVTFQVADTRVGRVTNYDKLTLEITTDGTVSPQKALEIASQILVNYFSGIVNPVPEGSASVVTAGSPRPTAGQNIAVEELDLPTRIANALQKAGFDTVSDLLAIPKAELAKVKNLGSKSVKIIEAALKERGFELV